MAINDGALELAVINPGAIFGPALSADAAGSLQVIQRLLNGQLFGLLDLTWGVVDVRDIADLHLRAMLHPDAAGERFIGIADSFMSMKEIALILKSRLGRSARRVPRRVLPNGLIRFMARFSPDVKSLLPALGKHKDASNEKARHVLGWEPRPSDEVLVATAESLMQLGLVKGWSA
jgi:nucleoside-diphosphate-sugar epimerase